MAAAARASSKPKSAQPQGRIDPQPRPMGGLRFGLVNEDPRKKYVGVFRGDEEAWATYSYMGYDTVKATPDGPRIKGARTPKMGEELEWKSHVIMEIARDEWQASYDQGQRYADAKSQAMKGRGGARQISRDPNIPVENETTDMGDFQ